MAQTHLLIVEINIPKQRDGEHRVGFIISTRSQDENRLDSVRDCIDRINDILHGRYQEPEEPEDGLSGLEGGLHSAIGSGNVEGGAEDEEDTADRPELHRAQITKKIYTEVHDETQAMNQEEVVEWRKANNDIRISKGFCSTEHYLFFNNDLSYWRAGRV